MAKIDELSELLVDELDQFHNTINKLHSLTTSLSSFKLEPDLTQLERLQSRHLENLNRTQKEQAEKTNLLLYHFKKGVSYPKWLIGMLAITGTAFFVLLGITIYQLKSIPEIKTEAMKKGRTSVLNHFEQFFDENPESSKTYSEWMKNPNE